MTQTLATILQADSFLDKNNMLHKNIGGVWISKPAIQIKPNGKGFQMVWEEDVKPNDIRC